MHVAAFRGGKKLSLLLFYLVCKHYNDVSNDEKCRSRLGVDLDDMCRTRVLLGCETAPQFDC